MRKAQIGTRPCRSRMVGGSESTELSRHRSDEDLSSFNTMLMYTRMRHSDLLNQVIGLAASNQSALIKSSVVMQQ